MLGFSQVRRKNLSLNLSLDDTVAQALEQAGQWLLKAASAMRDKAPPHPGNVLSLPTPQAFPDAPAALPDAGVPVARLVALFLRSRAALGRSDRYLRQLRVSLSSFATGRTRHPAEGVSFEQIETWLADGGWSGATKRGYLADVRTMFAWGVKRGLLAKSPAAAVELPTVVSGAPGILTPHQVREALEFARGHDPHLCRALAIQFFAGLRSAEVERIEEAAVRLDIGVIEVSAEKAKTRRRRAVAIQPNLLEWLALGGELPLRGNKSNRWRGFRHALRAKTGQIWPHNAARHSFVSYHLAAFGSAARTALEAGHTEQMTFSHYRALVATPDALAYWAIVPQRPVERSGRPSGASPPAGPGAGVSPGLPAGRPRVPLPARSSRPRGG